MRFPNWSKAAVPAVAAVAVLTLPFPLEHHARRALAVAAAMIAAWVVEFLNPAIVGFIGAFLFCAVAGMEFETAFAGFGTPVPWFLYGVLLLVQAAKDGGVVRRIGASSPAGLTRSPLIAAVVLVFLAYLLNFVVPSALARATIVALAALAWAGEQPSKRTMLLMVAAYASVAFEHSGLARAWSVIAGWDVAVAVALVLGAWILSRGSAPPADATPTAQAARGFDIKVGILLAVVVGLWMTSSLHRISPDLVGLVAGLATVLPGFSPATSRHARPAADALAIILAGTAISLPEVLVETKAAEVLVQAWAWLVGATTLPQDLIAYWATAAYRMFSPDGARVALPVLDGMNAPLGTMSTWAYGSSTVFSLYQSAALVLAWSLGDLRARHVLLVGVLLLAAGSVVVVVF